MCHSGLIDGAGADVSIDRQWRSTMMANAARDPLWLAKVSSEVARVPALRAAIEDKCSRCHMPMARAQALADKKPVAILDAGFLDPNHCLSRGGLKPPPFRRRLQEAKPVGPPVETGGFGNGT